MWVWDRGGFRQVGAGGIGGVVYVDKVKCVLVRFGIIGIGFIAYRHMGGFEAFNQAMAKLGASDIGKWGTTKGLGGGDYNAYLAIPGVIQFTAGLGKETPVGGLWTGVMVLTYMFALMGIHSAPAFTMWSFGNKDPRPFAPQQVWASSFGIGLILFFFTAAQGMGAHFLGASPEVTKAGMALANVLPDLSANKQGGLVPHYINLVGEVAPWFVGLLAVCALAAMQSTGAAYMSTACGMLTRDLYKRILNPTADHEMPKRFRRIRVAFVVR